MENLGIAYSFNGIHVIAKNMVQMPEPFVTTNYNFELKVEHRVKPEAKAVLSMVTIEISDEIKKDAILGSITVACVFEIKDFEQHIVFDEQKGVYEIPPPLDLALRPLSISTTRGVLHCEFRGTYLANALLPIVNTQAMQPLNPAVKK